MVLTINPISDATQYFDLLLLADPSPELVRDYIKHGYLFGAVEGEQIVGVYVILDHSETGGRTGTWELKNIAVDPAHQRRGVGQKLLDHAAKQAMSMGAKVLEVGTGDAGLANWLSMKRQVSREHVSIMASSCAITMNPSWKMGSNIKT